MSAVANLLYQAQLTQNMVRLNVDGVSHEESLIQPRLEGNCLNWVLGHLLAIYTGVLPLLGQQPVRPREELSRYARGASAITTPADALPLDDLKTWWEESCARVAAGLAALPEERLAERAPFSPTNNPDETVGSLLATVLFHQAYHAGQLGTLRRIAGKPGAIR
jgi:uncharacterized damage-inducible protein DinB